MAASNANPNPCDAPSIRGPPDRPSAPDQIYWQAARERHLLDGPVELRAEGDALQAARARHLLKALVGTVVDRGTLRAAGERRLLETPVELVAKGYALQ